MYHRFLLTAWLAPKVSNKNKYQMRRQYLLVPEKLVLRRPSKINFFQNE
jgi:hypothetical protein